MGFLTPQTPAPPPPPPPPPAAPQMASNAIKDAGAQQRAAAASAAGRAGFDGTLLTSPSGSNPVPSTGGKAMLGD